MNVEPVDVREMVPLKGMWSKPGPLEGQVSCELVGGYSFLGKSSQKEHRSHGASPKNEHPYKLFGGGSK